MGGGDPFSPDVHIDIPGHVTLPTQLDSIGISSGVTASAEQNGLDSPAEYPSDVSIDQSGAASLSSDQSLPSAGSSHSAFDAASSQSETNRVQTDGADSPDTNGNGRQTLLTDTNADVTMMSSDVTMMSSGGTETVTGLHIDLTASGRGHDVTESSPIFLYTDTGVFSHTDLVTMATDSTGTDTAADPTGSPLDLSRPAVTDHTQTAGPVTEQYNPSGQGPEVCEIKTCFGAPDSQFK
ncbi:uncharacterized protein LOC120570959 [Perca fluviatilis]|uniref:uncharacterized protein LOC120570959 n=1 Tax=Perca fluviatilis TaxID=8168 RepID=UPI0019641DCA|nr:uncharacterized protein LOC120570959 [Perca fluviatilis]